MQKQSLEKLCNLSKITNEATFWQSWELNPGTLSLQFLVLSWDVRNGEGNMDARASVETKGEVSMALAGTGEKGRMEPHQGF